MHDYHDIIANVGGAFLFGYYLAQHPGENLLQKLKHLIMGE